MMQFLCHGPELAALFVYLYENGALVRRAHRRTCQQSSQYFRVSCLKFVPFAQQYVVFPLAGQQLDCGHG